MNLTERLAAQPMSNPRADRVKDVAGLAGRSARSKRVGVSIDKLRSGCTVSVLWLAVLAAVIFIIIVLTIYAHGRREDQEDAVANVAADFLKDVKL